MAAREIPNLKTLLGRGRGGGLRGRGRGRGGIRPGREDREESEESDADRDSAVRGTDQDAAGSRLSCVELGYLDDPYAKLFATQTMTRRLPLLNRGTYVRTSAIDLLVDRFLTTSPNPPKQIISLGAGTDTRYFRLRDKYPNAHIIYHEVDFPANTGAKLHALQRHPELQAKLDLDTATKSQELGSYYSSTYNLHPLDLRVLASSSPDAPAPQLPNLDPKLPTLILSEMCLIYLPASTVTSIMSSLLTHYLPPTTPASLVLYEPILPNDAFGRTMISNLSTRNIHLHTLTAYPELGDQRARLKQYGFTDGHGAADTGLIWRKWVSEEEKERVAHLEMLDELEELELLLRHYCIAWGWRDGSEGDEGVFSKAWRGVVDQDGG
ncbi:leucine carboxyl methyltransferase [Lentithecium fluviatile CBS 122367]|uniref:Leucine carboxyl methyltransferase 1 n=1 Tax=Lentithecium fluviatile CBS 122367 TaxID=1168545 RepID=A0A6G1JCI4_9PLEO|nr:leucine carboxyl methyltransferase [Lentithecium fluviatile CBS 122367]